MTADPVRAALHAFPDPIAWLRTVREHGPPGAWIAAGAIRNTVWDHLHGFSVPTALNDIDVIWFDPRRTCATADHAAEATLARAMPRVPWSVRNQARMHRRHGDTPYQDAIEAMCRWPETATCVAARMHPDEGIEVAAPLGVRDLAGLILRPTPLEAARGATAFRQRVQSRGWLQLWPRLTVIDEPP